MKIPTFFLSTLLFIVIANIACRQRPYGAENNNDSIPTVTNVAKDTTIVAYSRYYVDDTARRGGGTIKVSFFGVSSLLFDDGETQIMVDGYFSRYPLQQTQTSLISSDSLLVNRFIGQYNMKSVKALFVTHSHWDHAFDVAQVGLQTGANVHGSVSTLNVARGGGVPERQLKLIKHGQKIRYGKFNVEIIASKHSPSALVDKEKGRLINVPLRQPARATDYVEGGSYDFLISHGANSIYVKPSAAWVEGALDNKRADVLFLGIATLGLQDSVWRDTFYQQTVGKLRPRLVLPLHWDDFFQPVTDSLPLLPGWADKVQDGFDYIITRTATDSISFKILQGTKSILLFGDRPSVN